MKQRSFSVLGNIAIVNFSDKIKQKDKKIFAKEILEKNKAIKTILEKSGKFSGRLRKQKTKILAGEKTKEVLYKENNCIFRFNIDEIYFSPRLANERKEICKIIKPSDEVFVMCAGVTPFPIVIAKNTKVKKIYSNEINKKANNYAQKNIIRNKLKDKIELIPGDIKKVAPRLAKEGKKYDLIMMTRPNLKETFLKEAFILSKPGTRIYYHGFCKLEERKKLIEEIKKEAKKAEKEIKITNTKNIGEIAPYKVRFRVEFVVLGRKKFWKRLFDAIIK
jgi:tRNA (guanine37-N1)-methyltransferase